MIRKKKKYKRPLRLYEAARIKEENLLVKKYGLKNKREIWKAQAKVDYYRNRAKALAKKPLEEQEVLFNKLKALGLNTSTIADVLDLKIEDILNRRLPTIVAQKKLANTIKQARQMVVHKIILINGKVISSPSYLVPVAKESEITLKKKVKKPRSVIEEPELEENVGEKTGEVKEEPKQEDTEEKKEEGE